MTKEEKSVEAVVNSFMARLGEYDAEGIGKLFADDIDWLVPGDTSLPWIGRRSHGNEVAEYFKTMWPHFEKGKSIITPGNIVFSGSEAVLFANFQHTALETGRIFFTPVAMHLTIKDGKIKRMNLYEDTWAVSQAFAK